MKNYLSVYKNLIVSYKINLVLDVEFKEGCYINAKYVSFFGQVGVCENKEKLLNLVNDYYKKLNFNKGAKLLNEKENTKVFFKFYKYSKVEENSRRRKLNLIEQKDIVQYDECNNKVEEGDENYIFFYITLVMAFYKKDWKINCFFRNEIKKIFFFKKN